jgi:hypothetical protein
MRKFLLTVMFAVLILPICWGQGSLNFFTEGRLYFSGDAIRMLMVPIHEDGALITDDTRVQIKLLNALGSIMHTEEYLVTELGKDGVFILPEELPTGNYRVIASFGDIHYQVTIHVYEPSVLTSLQLPKNLDPELGLDSTAFSVDNPLKYVAGSNATYDLGLKSQSSLVVKIFENTVAGYPGIGKIVNTADMNVPTQYKVNTISSNADSRISIYFIDQRKVEEHYVDELEWLNIRMGRHYGTSRLWAYQFDAQGNKLGPVNLEITTPRMPAFARASDAVPFDAGVRRYLEERKNRKFIDQVYGKSLANIQHYAAEETDDPDISVSVDEYAGLASLEEVLSNIVPKTQVIRKNKQSEIRLSPDNSGFRYSEGPFVLVNGLPVTRLDSLLDVPARQVETVSVFNSIETLRQFGTLGRFGVIEITLKPESEWQHSQEFPVFKGINDLEVLDETIESPDLRPEVFWGYLRKSALNLNWVNPDVSGDYIIWAIPMDGDQDIILPLKVEDESR